MNENALSMLICPDTEERLELKEDELFTSKTSYPLLNGIPWLFKDPEYSFLEWGTKIENYLAAEQNFQAYIDLLIQGELNALTKKRMVKLKEGKQKNLNIFKKELSSFLGHNKITLEPSNQQIHSYFQLIFRDWCWDTDENDKYLNFIKKESPSEPKSILILGAGACGLSYKIANHFNNSTVYSVDHNPFLFFMAEKILKGYETKLTDYTFYPKNLASTTHQWNIKIEAIKNPNHHLILSSFPHLPFKKESFDLIIAPWFLDILELDYASALNETLNFLKKDGTFISVGPANVHTKKIFNQFSPEEKENEVKNYFSKISKHQFETQYLNNPIESYGRLEEIICLAGKHKNDFKFKPNQNNNPSQIKFTDSLREYKEISLTLSRILKHIDKDISYKELSDKVKEEFNITEKEALYYTQVFMKKIEMDI